MLGVVYSRHDFNKGRERESARLNGVMEASDGSLGSTSGSILHTSVLLSGLPSATTCDACAHAREELRTSPRVQRARRSLEFYPAADRRNGPRALDFSLEHDIVSFLAGKPACQCLPLVSNLA